MRVEVHMLPAGAPNRPGEKLRGSTPWWITVHETANNQAGADADAHRRFVHAGGGPEGVSFHWVVDDVKAIQLLPMSEKAWHAGDGSNGPGNAASVAVELCVNEDADWHQMMLNAATLVGTLCWLFALGPERVVQHNRWSGKQCPAWLRGTGLWDVFLHRVKGRIAALEAEAP